jgi:hypothetical protein
MLHCHRLPVLNPLVHAPEVRVVQFQIERVHDAGDKRQLLRGADGAANADGVVGRGLLPGANVFQRFGAIELFESIVDCDFKAVARKFK